MFTAETAFSVFSAVKKLSKVEPVKRHFLSSRGAAGRIFPHKKKARRIPGFFPVRPPCFMLHP